MARGAVWWPAVLFGACGIEDPQEYAEELAAAECDRIETCSLGYFQSEYVDADDCRQERRRDLDEANDGLDDAGCRFVAEEAGPCVSRVNALSCEDWAEDGDGLACDLVWDCAGIRR